MYIIVEKRALSYLIKMYKSRFGVWGMVFRVNVLLKGIY